MWANKSILGIIEGNVNVVSHVTELDSRGTTINGWFNCGGTRIITLDKSPAHVNGSFDCSYTDISSLEGAPEYVGGDFICHHTKIISLQNIHKQVKHIGGVLNIPHEATSHIIGVLFIKGLKSVAIEGSTLYVYAPYIPVTAKGGSSGIGAGPYAVSVTISFEPHIPSKLQQAVDIINKHLAGERNPHDAQQELIDADLSEFAKI